MEDSSNVEPISGIPDAITSICNKSSEKKNPARIRAVAEFSSTTTSSQIFLDLLITQLGRPAIVRRHPNGPLDGHQNAQDPDH